MTISNGYATLADVKAAFRIIDDVDDTLLELSIESASREIDGWCERVSTTQGPPREFMSPQIHSSSKQKTSSPSPPSRPHPRVTRLTRPGQLQATTN